MVNITIPWQNIIEMSIITLCSLFLMVIVALPIMSISGQILSLIRQRSAYAKCAKQLASLALFLGWFMTLSCFYPLWIRVSPSILELISKMTVDGQAINYLALWEPIKASVYLQAHVYAAGLLLFASIFLSIFRFSWKVWKKHRLILQCLAIVASCWYAMAFYGIICIISADNALALGIEYPLSLNAFYVPSLDSSLLTVILFLLPLSFALAGGIATFWLIIRRNRDDFGRDYYAQMLPWCASWARNAWIFYWLILLSVTALQWLDLLQKENYLSNPEFMRSVAFVFMWLIPGILWAIVIKSAYPLRHKFTLILAFIFSLCSIVPLYNAL